MKQPVCVCCRYFCNFLLRFLVDGGEFFHDLLQIRRLVTFASVRGWSEVRGVRFQDNFFQSAIFQCFCQSRFFEGNHPVYPDVKVFEFQDLFQFGDASSEAVEDPKKVLFTGFSYRLNHFGYGLPGVDSHRQFLFKAPAQLPFKSRYLPLFGAFIPVE